MAKDKAEPARLLLVRHGQIAANVEQRWHGSTDSALTPQGREQAQRVALHLAARTPRVAAVYASPLARARDTAAAIGTALGLPVALEPDLMEFGIGELENQPYQTLLGEHRFFERILSDPDYAPRGGESLRGVTERTSRALRGIARAHSGQDVAVVGHGAALALALAWLLDGDRQAWRRYHVANCSVSELVLEPEPELLLFDGTEHLDER